MSSYSYIFTLSGETIRASLDLLSPANMIFPFLVHALGTLVGAFLIVKLAASHHMRFALGIGAFFLIGGITAASMIGDPAWFNVIDLLLAYIPMGYLGGLIGGAKKSQLAEQPLA